MAPNFRMMPRFRRSVGDRQDLFFSQADLVRNFLKGAPGEGDVPLEPPGDIRLYRRQPRRYGRISLCFSFSVTSDAEPQDIYYGVSYNTNLAGDAKYFLTSFFLAANRCSM